MKNICIYGAGAIGGWMGFLLASAGYNVSMVARGETLAALQKHGLRLSHGGIVDSVPVKASADPAEFGVQDLVVIAVKAPSLAQIAKSIAPLIGPHTVVLTAMNGVPWWFFNGFGGELENTQLKSVDPTGEIAKAIAPQHLVGCVVHVSALVKEPGLIHHHHGSRMIIGEPSGGRSERVSKLSEILMSAGMEGVVSEKIQQDTFFKLWGNMTMNPISAITGATADRVLADPLARAFMSNVMLEAREIGARIGIPIEEDPEERHLVTEKLGAFKTSMLQDVEANRAIELDALVSSVREIGQLVKVATPNIDALLGLTRLRAQTLGLY